MMIISRYFLKVTLGFVFLLHCTTIIAAEEGKVHSISTTELQYNKTKPEYLPPGARINHHGWQGHAVFNPENGHFVHCIARKAYEDRSSLALLMNEQSQLQIEATYPAWSLTGQEGRLIELELSFDNGGGQGRGVATSQQSIAIGLGNEQKIIDTLRRSRSLKVKAQNKEVQFLLSGSSQVLEKLRACVSETKDLVLDLPSKEPPGMSFEFLVALLHAAGLREVWYLSPDSIPDNEMHLRFMWRVEQVLGGLYQETRQQQPSTADAQSLIDQFAERYTGIFTGFCQEGFERALDDSRVLRDIYAVKTGNVTCRRGGQTNLIAFFFALDDYNYSAFLHQGGIDERQAVQEATDRIVSLVTERAFGVDIANSHKDD
jgi:hypothetical protein